MGLVLGLSWLVKFTMVMASGGVILFLLAHHVAEAKKQSLPIAPRIFPVAMIAILCGLIGSSWYIYGHLSGQGRGALEITWMLNDKDFFARFQQQMSWQLFLGGIGAMLESGVFVYNSLSRATAGYLSYLLYVLAIAIVLAYAVALKRNKNDDLHGLPLYVIALPFLMLLVHIAYSITELGYYITSGRYLLVVLPAFLMITGIGMRELAHAKDDFKIIAYAAFLAAPVASLYLFWHSMAIFGGCATEQNPPSGEFAWAPPYCLDQFAPIVTNLGVFGWPFIGVACFVSGWLLLVYAVGHLFRITAKAQSLQQPRKI